MDVLYFNMMIDLVRFLEIIFRLAIYIYIWSGVGVASFLLAFSVFKIE